MEAEHRVDSALSRLIERKPRADHNHDILSAMSPRLLTQSLTAIGARGVGSIQQLRFFAREAKQSVVIPPPPPHKYKALGDAVRLGSGLLGLGLIAYILTLERTDDPHWTTLVKQNLFNS